MDLAERLRELAKRLGDIGHGIAVASKLEALADEVAGKVLVTPCEIKSRTAQWLNGSTYTHFPAVLTDVMLGLPTFTGHGVSHADALVNLQRKADGL